MTWDSVWENVHKEKEWGKYPGEDLIRFIALNFYGTQRENTKILEVGCGQGANIWFLAREGFTAYGIDGSLSAIEKAKKLLELENLKCNLFVGDIVQLPFADNFFDAVIDIECLYCNSWLTSEKILEEINRTLKKGGLFYSRTFSTDSYIGINSREKEQSEYNNISEGPLAEKGFARFCNLKDINKLYGKFFEVISVDKLEYTKNNQLIKVSEWLILCRK